MPHGSGYRDEVFNVPSKHELDDFKPPRVRYLAGGKTYFIADSCEAWRLYDISAPRPGQRRAKVAIGSRSAASRVFVNGKGDRYAYVFREAGRRDPSPRMLAMQLQAAAQAAITAIPRVDQR